MAVDSVFVDGVIAVKEKALLGSRILKMCECSAEEAFRMLTESGFARGTEVSSVYEYERLLEADEKQIDAFIREYCPTNAVKEYFFAPRDYHNAKALVKCERLSLAPDKMLAGEGLCPVTAIKAYIKGEKSELPADLAAAIDRAQELFSKGTPSGAEVGAVFDGALYSHLYKACRRDGLLKGFILRRADMTNILTAMRSASPEHARSGFLPIGKISPEKLLTVFEEGAQASLDDTPYKDFWRSCLQTRENGLPQTAAERTLAGLEESFLKEKKYELKNKQPFLYYVFKRRAENQNVRIILSCLIAGMDAEQIKARLRSFD